MPSNKSVASKRVSVPSPPTSGVARCAKVRARPDGTRKLRAVEDALATYSLASDNLHVAVEALRDLLGADQAFLCSLAQRPEGDDLVVTRAHAAHAVPPSAPGVDYERGLNELLRGRGSAWGGYDVLRPEPEHRDRALRTAEIVELTGGRGAQIETELYARMGFAGRDTMRVLVCDGPAMLAWLSVFQDQPATDEQRTILERLVPAFRRRLLFERQIQQSRITDGALRLVLEELPSAAWVVGPNGRVAAANAAGHARLDTDRVATTRALRAAATTGSRREDMRSPVTRRRDAIGGGVSLLVEVSPPSAYGVRDITHVGGQLGLTPAQSRVFEHLARGASNGMIASELGIAERTVEAHVTAILVKAQVPNRATLIVRVFEGARALAAVPGAV